MIRAKKHQSWHTSMTSIQVALIDLAEESAPTLRCSDADGFSAREIDVDATTFD